MEKPVELPVACDLNALTSAERARHRSLVGALALAIVGRTELVDGFELCVDPTKLELPLLAEWIALEGRCCPFLHFRIELAPGAGGATVALTGGDGVKDFLRAAMGFPKHFGLAARASVRE